MFTGIVEETGTVRRFARGERAWNLELEAGSVTEGLETGDSIAVNGCCLTAVAAGPNRISFDLLEETVRVTSFRQLREGERVNLERSLRFDGKVGGHFVTGHIDCAGEVSVLEQRGTDYYIEVKPPEAQMRYLIHKGSIAIDGISLTVAELMDDRFAVWLIPHTMAVTNLIERKPGDLVNLEFDLLGKYVERLLMFDVRSPGVGS